MRAVKLRGKVLIDPNDDSVDLFTKSLRNANARRTMPISIYWLKILANSIYGFFVELIPEHFKQPKNVMVLSRCEFPRFREGDGRCGNGLRRPGNFNHICLGRLLLRC